jgi:hypothetical protein
MWRRKESTHSPAAELCWNILRSSITNEEDHDLIQAPTEKLNALIEHPGKLAKNVKAK